MRTFSLDRSRLAQTAIVTLATSIALVMLAIVLAHWTWTWIAPAPEAAAPPVATGATTGMRAGGLFGDADAAPPVAVASVAGIRLLGVVAGATGTGYAVMQVDGQPIAAVREGRDVAPGLVLMEVHARGVVLARGGIRETLALPPVAAPTPIPAE
jgi:general secretion pathway protein C